jgi:hypothetical protein
MTCQARSVVLHLAEGLVFLLHKRPSVFEKNFTGWGQPHLSRTALEKLYAKFPFQALNA